MDMIKLTYQSPVEAERWAMGTGWPGFKASWRIDILGLTIGARFTKVGAYLFGFKMLFRAAIVRWT